MKVLRINAVFHESATALAVDEKVVPACEEERFNRVKHAKPSRVENPHELPEYAIRFCLLRNRPAPTRSVQSFAARNINRSGGLTAGWRLSSCAASVRSAPQPTVYWSASSAAR